MNNFHWGRGFGLGVALWLIMFTLVSILVGFGVAELAWMQVIAAVIAGVLAYFLALYAQPHTTGQAFGYGLLWVVVGLVLDLIVTARFNNQVFYAWQYWLGYAMVLIAPWLESASRQSGGAVLSGQ